MPIYSNRNDWGGNSISKLLFDYLLDTLPKGKTILELGSGWGTGQLMRHWNVWSIESEDKWFKLYNSQSVLIPITEKGGWYNYDMMKDFMYKMRGNYDLLLVDGPYDNREKIVDNMWMFNFATPIVFDDVRREEGRKIIEDVSDFLKRPYTIHGEGRSMFGVIR